MDLPAMVKRKEDEKHGKRRSSSAVTDEARLSSARGIFSRKGYIRTSVREIVAAAGVTKPGSAKPIGEERG
jgi:AcrR family transcriptional regulator